MPPLAQAGLRNVLLRSLHPEGFALLAPHLEPVDLPRDLVLSEPDRPSEHAFFLDRGIGSIVAVSPNRQMVEAGLFGRDGFWPVSLALGVGHSPYQTIMQVPGEGHRVPVEALGRALDGSAPLHGLLLRFAHTLAVQVSYTALSNAVHPIDKRLARWLLMCHDRAGHELALTHTFLASMLGVRRPSVTTALHVLAGHGLIQAERGVVTVTNRKALERFASDAYGRPEAEYERLIGPLA